MIKLGLRSLVLGFSKTRIRTLCSLCTLWLIKVQDSRFQGFQDSSNKKNKRISAHPCKSVANYGLWDGILNSDSLPSKFFFKKGGLI